MARSEIKTAVIAIGLKNLIPSHAQEVLRIADDHPEANWPLDPEEIRYPPIVRRVKPAAGQSSMTAYAVVDGFHRLSRMAAFGATKFPVIVVEAPQSFLRAIDADSEIGGHPELDTIYEAAGFL